MRSEVHVRTIGRIIAATAGVMMLAGCGLGSAKFGDPEIPPQPAPPSGQASKAASGATPAPTK